MSQAWDEDEVEAMETMSPKQARTLEARITARMERSERREELRQMVQAVVSGGGLESLTIPSTVNYAVALLAEIDRRCTEPEPREVLTCDACGATTTLGREGETCQLPREMGGYCTGLLWRSGE